MYDEYKMFGPYTRNDKRKVLILQDKVGNLRTLSYPKYLVELALNRKLTKNETVHHKDGDVTNNQLENLEILERTMHVKKDVFKFLNRNISCVWCGKSIKQMTIGQRNQKKAGPFCFRRCVGQYGAEVQNGRHEKLGNYILNSLDHRTQFV